MAQTDPLPDFGVTYEGRMEADRVRRRRENLTDAALAGISARLLKALPQEQRSALTVPLTDLRAALDAERYPTAVGAAKDLAEAACKVSIVVAGGWHLET